MDKDMTFQGCVFGQGQYAVTYMTTMKIHQTSQHSEMNPKKNLSEISLSDALTGAAVAFANVFSPSQGQLLPLQNRSVPPSPGLSPSKTVDLRMKNFEQLRYLQQLYDDGILTTRNTKNKRNKYCLVLGN